MELAIEAVSKRYGISVAVDDISVRLRPGVYGLLGANGAGKTTLMRMICGILSPTSGHIALNGKPIAGLGEAYRNLLGYLPQDFGYYPDFTALQFMHYTATLKGLNIRAAKQRTTELLERVSLLEASGKKIRTFSGGMKQRLGIAQALLNDPDILVLDEPTAGLDPKERVRFRNMIAALAKDKIVLLSTHIVPDVEHIAHQILMMKKGRILMSGTAQDLTRSMEGRVWLCRLAEGEAESFSRAFLIGNLKHEGNEVELRVISDSPPLADAVRAAPTLEDLYLYHFHEESDPAVSKRKDEES